MLLLLSVIYLEENGNNKDAVAELKGENKWIEAVNNCATWSRLHLLMSLLDSNVKWEKSAENAVKYLAMYLVNLLLIYY